MNDIIGAVVWVCVSIIGCIIYIKLVVLSCIQYLLPSSHTVIKNVADCMTAIVSEYGFREETADISGVSVHCVIKDATATIDATDVSAPDVIVFIHGTASSSLIFFDVMKHLPRNQKCVAIDLPNFGISGRIDLDKYPTNQELCQCYSDIIGHTLQTLGIIEHTVLVAHSLGGFLSIYVADRFPLKKLVLLNPAGILPTLGEYGYYWGCFSKQVCRRHCFIYRWFRASYWRICGVRARRRRLRRPNFGYPFSQTRTMTDTGCYSV